MTLKDDILPNVSNPHDLAVELSTRLKSLNGLVANVGAVDALGAQAALVGVDGVGDTAAPLDETEDRLLAIEATLDAVIAKLVTAGILVTP